MKPIICWKLLRLRNGILWTLCGTFGWDSIVLDGVDGGVYAIRYGAGANPKDDGTGTIVLARCEVPPDAHVIVTPWDVRSERLIVTGLRVCEAIVRHDADGYWRSCVDILPCIGSGIYIVDESFPTMIYERNCLYASTSSRELHIYWVAGDLQMTIADSGAPWRSVYQTPDEKDVWPRRSLPSPANIRSAAYHWRKRLMDIRDELAIPCDVFKCWLRYLRQYENHGISGDD